MKQIPFIDLKEQQERIRPQIDLAINKVLDHGQYIMGPEIFELEEKLANYCDAKHVISCSSGTDAILMVLMAKGIGPGDAVFIPSFTFPATPEVVALLGATPVLVDVIEKTYNIDPESVRKGIEIANKQSLTPKVIISVDLFGQPVDYSALEEVASEYNLWILADAAQSFGASLNNKKVGKLAYATTTSFFPAKPLGCYGDGGAVFTDDDELAHILRSIRVHGKGQHKYDNVRIGLNARLDTLQAAILLEKLKVFDEELEGRQRITTYYNEILSEFVQVPYLISDAKSAWAQYTVRLPQGSNRVEIMRSLKEIGIPTMIYYEKPLHLQIAYKNFPAVMQDEMMVSESLANHVLSLPMSSRNADFILESINNIFKRTL